MYPNFKKFTPMNETSESITSDEIYYTISRSDLIKRDNDFFYNGTCKNEDELKAIPFPESIKPNWEYFCDESYYHLWAVRLIGNRDFKSQKLFHVQSKEEAIALCNILNNK